MQRPAFVEALAHIRDALRLRTELHLTAAAAQAARQLQSPPTPDSGLGTQHFRRSLDLLRLTHLRQPNPIESSDGGDDDADNPVNTPSEPMTFLPAFATISPPARADGPRGNTF